MKLKRVLFDRYVGDDLQRQFKAEDGWSIELDDLNRIHMRKGSLSILTLAHNADMYPAEEPIAEPGPARALPGKPRQRA